MRRRGPHAVAVVAVAGALVAFPATTVAQERAHLAGSVHDQTGGTLEGVTISLSGADERETQTDADGRFEFRNLPPGDYSVEAVRRGFAAARRDVRLQAGDTVTVSLMMAVAIVEQTVVSAAKVGEDDVLSIPLAVSAITSAELARFGTRSIDDATPFIPSVTFTQNSTYGQLSIRGIGTNAVHAGTDPSAAVYLDGVYLARPAMLFLDLLDLERVEVLRGPQGTLYGRNAVGGALNLISKTPTNDFEASARVTAGNLGELRAEARASGALQRDRVMGGVAFVRGARDGYVRDLEHPDRPLGGDDLIAARGHLRLVFDRRFDFLVSADVTEQDGTLLTYNKVLQVKPGFVIDNPPDLREVRTSTATSSGVRQSGAAARLTSALTSSTTLVSLTAFRRLDNRFLADVDVTELELAVADNGERQHQWSQELTLLHERPRLTGVAGLFLFGESADQRIWAQQPPAGLQVLLDPRVDAASTALFGQATVGVTPRLSITAGLRYTRERKTIDNGGGLYSLEAVPTPVANSTYAYSDAIEHAAWTPKVGVELALRPRGIAYLSAARGFKSGGFNLSSTQPGRSFGPEWAWNYEAGLKTPLGNGRARLAVAAFHMDYTNLQVQTPIGIGVFDVRNAAAATIRGVEVEANARVGSGLAAGGHVSWLDATYDRYVAVAIGGVIGDVAGNRLNNAPEWAGRIWMEWTRDVGRSKRLSIAADATAQSTVFYAPFNDDIQRQLPYGLLGARAEYGPVDRQWSVNAYVRNVTDTDYITAAFATSPAAYAGRPGASRQFGVQVVVRRQDP